MEWIESKAVSKILEQYPPRARKKLLQLRRLILTTAKATEGVDQLVETTKWGEPSYLTKTGSTIRMDWKPKTPDNYYLYFICSTELVNTFRIIFGEELAFESNRAIVLNLKEPMPTEPLRRCITLALTYQKVKHLPMLGV
ncbi:MAG TPA: DUF1801 domain-containing protein [Cyclobacteriaceae bacterium]|jgi:hypothetical protein|nr:DUF1801 domain-containing protein [Cyclobacteriaceae bacterium]HRK54461.1 DUF1801 domain-containing protein [Cyclobacteriaceae bacterium]